MSFDKQTEVKNLVDIKPYLSHERTKVAGENEKSRILKQEMPYTDTKSLDSNFARYAKEHLFNNLGINIQGEKVMDDNRLLEMYIDKVDKDQRDLKEDIRESERRTQKRIEESDKRLDEKMGQIIDMIRDQNQKMDKIDSKIETVSKEVSAGLAEYRKFMWGITISIFLAIAAMILTIIVA